MAIRELPIDTTNLVVTVADNKVNAKRIYDSEPDPETGLKAHAFDERTGNNLWNMMVSITDTVNQIQDVARVTVASDVEPTLEFQAPVTFMNLRALPWTNEGSGINLSFKADKVECKTTKKSATKTSSDYTASGTKTA